MCIFVNVYADAAGLFQVVIGSASKWTTTIKMNIAKIAYALATSSKMKINPNFRRVLVRDKNGRERR